MNSIQTERLVLRNFLESDAADLLEYLRKPVASCFFSLALQSLSEAISEAKKRGTSDEYLAVCLRSSGKIIGDVFAAPQGDTLSIGWNFNPAFSGQGYAIEAAKALTAYLFSATAARRLYAYVEDSNLPSQRLCEKLGMRKEGLFQEFVTFKNDLEGRPIYENTMQYAILRKEWELTSVPGPLAAHHA